MKTLNKRIWLALALAIAFAAAAGLLWKKDSPPQIITDPIGNQYRFAGVSYGTRHTQPTLQARWVSAVPSPLTNLVQKMFGARLGPITSFRTPEPTLVVWFETIGTNVLFISGFFAGSIALLDQDGVEGSRPDSTPLSALGQWPHVSFQIVPRRSRELQCVFRQDQDEFGRVRFRNPLFGKYPQCQAEPLPAVKSAGDVEVRLVRLRTGAPSLTNTLGPVPKGFAAWTVFDVSLKPKPGNSARWEVHTAELSDATGNRIQGTPYRSHYGLALPGTLWPGEAAWRLKLELKRVGNFSLTELVTFANVPVPAIGSSLPIPLTNTIDGVQVALTGFVHRPEFTNNPFLDRSLQLSGVVVMVLGGPEGVSLDFVSITTQAGEKLDVHQLVRSESRSYVFLKSIPTNATAVDITWAVQKTRTVEFLVEPPKAE